MPVVAEVEIQELLVELAVVVMDNLPQIKDQTEPLIQVAVAVVLLIGLVAQAVQVSSFLEH